MGDARQPGARGAGGRAPRLPLALGAAAPPLPGRARRTTTRPCPASPWPDAFESVADPVVSLAFVAGVTSRIRLGTSVLVMPYYTPVMLAKQLATLDRVSGGRLDVGLGVGWSRDEYDAVGVPFERRGRRGRRVPRLPQGDLDAGPGRVPRRVLPGAARLRPAPARPGRLIPRSPWAATVSRGRPARRDLRRRLQRRQRAVRPRGAPRPGAARWRRSGPGAIPPGSRSVCRGTFQPFDTPQGPWPPAALRLDRGDPRRTSRRYAELGRDRALPGGERRAPRLAGGAHARGHGGARAGPLPRRRDGRRRRRLPASAASCRAPRW